MPVLNDMALGDARRIAVSAASLSVTADSFRLALAEVSRAAARHLIDVVPSNTGIVRNFGLETAHGQVEAIFDHAFKGEQLVGRYRFFTVEKTATGDVEAKDLWDVLFDTNYNATWDPKENYGWTFTPGDYQTPVMMGRFVLTLLAKIQARLRKYETTTGFNF